MAGKSKKSQLDLLNQEREHTVKEIENLRAELRTELEHDDIDDAASDLIERDKIHALILTLERKLKDVDHAIKGNHSSPERALVEEVIDHHVRIATADLSCSTG